MNERSFIVVWPSVAKILTVLSIQIPFNWPSCTRFILLASSGIWRICPFLISVIKIDKPLGRSGCSSSTSGLPDHPDLYYTNLLKIVCPRSKGSSRQDALKQSLPRDEPSWLFVKLSRHLVQLTLKRQLDKPRHPQFCFLEPMAKPIQKALELPQTSFGIFKEDRPAVNELTLAPKLFG